MCESSKRYWTWRRNLLLLRRWVFWRKQWILRMLYLWKVCIDVNGFQIELGIFIIYFVKLKVLYYEYSDFWTQNNCFLPVCYYDFCVLLQNGDDPWELCVLLFCWFSILEISWNRGRTKQGCRFLKVLVLNKVELEGKAVTASARLLWTDPQLLLFFALDKANSINVLFADLKFSSAENGLSSFSPSVVRTWGFVYL